MTIRSPLPLALLGVTVLSSSLTARAATFNVNSTADAVDAAPGNGTCASAGGDCTLRAAIMEANALAGSHTINVPAGLYVLTIPGIGEENAAQGDLDVTGNVTIVGAGPGETIVDGGGIDRVFEIIGTAQISGMTIRNGAAVSPGTPFFGSNFVGGLVENLGTLTLTDCTLEGGRANVGGAIWSGGPLTIDSCTIGGNEAVNVGISNILGGGLALLDGTTTVITNSTISRNWSGGNGGAIDLESGTLTLTNVTLSGNVASGSSVLESTNGIVTLREVTMSNNVGSGAAIRHFSFDGTRKVTVVNSILAANTSGNCGSGGLNFVSQGGNVESGTDCGFTLGTDHQNADPRLGPLVENGGSTQTHALFAGSAALNAGTSAGCTATDQRGTARPKGAACDSGAFESEPAATYRAVRTVPILLDVFGTGGAHFTSQLTLANRGTTPVSIALTYTAASALGATGTGTANESLIEGQELFMPDALAYLRGKGLAIPTSGSQGGTLRAVFTGLSSADAAFAGARTTSASGAGRAGLSYQGPRSDDTGRGALHLFGLRNTAADRTNLALVNVDTADTFTLKVTLTSGVPGDPRTYDVPPVTLAPGQWTQINAPDLLVAAGMTNAWATVRPVSGTAQFLAYAVFNDNKTDDGSFVPAVRVAGAGPNQVLPALVESDSFQSELVLANPTDQPMQVSLTLTLSLGSFLPSANPTLVLTLAPHEQRIIPTVLQAFRQMGLGIEPSAPGKTIVGTLAVAFAPSGAAPASGYVGARTASPAPTGGGYGLFYPGVPAVGEAQEEAWVYGLVQDAASRSNLAILNAGPDATEITVRVDVFATNFGVLVGGSTVTLPAGGWSQINTILAPFSLSEGYVRIRRTSGTNRFIAYGVVNDGATPGRGTSDGSYVAMTVVR
ncbi:MAG: choice-of-anchor Q domain-containing protein [Thermoanaerobaculia bacterium]